MLVQVRRNWGKGFPLILTDTPFSGCYISAETTCNNIAVLLVTRYNWTHLIWLCHFLVGFSHIILQERDTLSLLLQSANHHDAPIASNQPHAIHPLVQIRFGCNSNFNWDDDWSLRAWHKIKWIIFFPLVFTINRMYKVSEWINNIMDSHSIHNAQKTYNYFLCIKKWNREKYLVKKWNEISFFQSNLHFIVK